MSSVAAFASASSFCGVRVGVPRRARVCGTAAPTPAPRMQAGGGSIDFSKVNIATAGENLAGLVFTPEAPSAALESRVGGLGYTSDQEHALNKHINVEYTAMYAYHALWAYFDRDTVALPGFAKYFDEQSKEEREHASEFMKYQNTRGGKVELFPVAVPEMAFTETDGASDALYAADLSLQLEKFVYLKLKDLHKVAEDAGDPEMTNFVENYLSHQVEAIKSAADLVAQLKRVGTGHGVYHIDRVLLDDDCAGDGA